jgi:hypothetical protein
MSDNAEEPIMMSDNAEDVLHRRLNDIERDNRRLKRVTELALCTCILVFLGTSTWMICIQFSAYRKGTFNAKLVSAEKFYLLDKNGRVRASLSENPAGSFCLDFYDADNRSRASVCLDDDNRPGVFLYNAKGNAQVGIGEDKSGHPNIQLYDMNKKLRIRLFIDLSETPRLFFYDEEGRLVDPAGAR